jgi:ABC-type glycerol-3-phosphate transport system permease component
LAHSHLQVIAIPKWGSGSNGLPAKFVLAEANATADSTGWHYFLNLTFPTVNGVVPSQATLQVLETFHDYYVPLSFVDTSNVTIKF